MFLYGGLLEKIARNIFEGPTGIISRFFRHDYNVVDIVYKKIKNMHEIMMIPAIPITEPIECSICMSNIENSRLMAVTRCNHYFHRTCLLKWKTRKVIPTCPNCRVTI